MAQWIKVVAAKPADLNSIPWIHMVEREPAPEDCPLTSTHLPWQVPSIPPI